MLQLLLIFSLFTPFHGETPPPGTARIAENLFVDIHLIHQEDYREFLYALRDSPEYAQMLPADTLLTYSGNQIWNNKEYSLFPVTGLTHAQILHYCNWRSGAVNSIKNGRKNSNCSARYRKKMERYDADQSLTVVYSLPTKDELERAHIESEKLWLDEVTSDGIVQRNVSAKLNRNDMTAFRCVARYVESDK